jgi:hypothetical protein
MTVAVYPITAGAANIVALPVRPHEYLGIFNQSITATVYVAFDTPAIAAATAGQVTLLPVVGANKSSVEFTGNSVPNGAINVIASAAATPVTIIG